MLRGAVQTSQSAFLSADNHTDTISLESTLSPAEWGLVATRCTSCATRKPFLVYGKYEERHAFERICAITCLLVLNTIVITQFLVIYIDFGYLHVSDDLI